MLRSLIVVAIAILAAMGLLPTSAQAWPRCESGYECWYDWYSDAAHQTSEGGRPPHLSFSSWHY